ncbi:MAG: hypothetical protein ACJ8EL_04795 [Rhizomicrobium sp.]|jgi:hypothetical protein
MSNSPLGNKYVLAALREKRATLAGELEQLKKQITWKQTQLASVDDTLTLFDASYSPGSIRPKKPYQRIHLFKQGEMTGAILKALREAGKPCSTAQMVTAVLAETGDISAGWCRSGSNDGWQKVKFAKSETFVIGGWRETASYGMMASNLVRICTQIPRQLWAMSILCNSGGWQKPVQGRNALCPQVPRLLGRDDPRSYQSNRRTMTQR